MSDRPAKASAAGGCPPAELVLAQLDTLPTLAPVAVRLLQITLDADSSARDVVELLRADQALTAKVLAVANSAALGAPGKVATLDRAVALLGFRVIRSVALAVKVLECFPTPEQAGFDRKAFWKHALGVACAARRLAARPAAPLDAEEAFVAGLLHDIGKLALAAAFPKAYQRVVAEAASGRCDIVDCERAVLGVDHTVAGRRLAERWGLPDLLRDVIWLHNKPPETVAAATGQPAAVNLIRLADALVRQHHIGDSGNHAPVGSLDRLRRACGVEESGSERFGPELFAELADCTRLLGLEEEPGANVYLDALNRANAELDRLNRELLAGERASTAAARCYDALAQFEEALDAGADVGRVVAAMADAARTLLGRPMVLAFALHAQQAAAEVCRSAAESWQCRRSTEALSDVLRSALLDVGKLNTPGPLRAPPPIAAWLSTFASQAPSQCCWLLPVARGGQLAGGIAIFSDEDEPNRLAAGAGALRSFLSGCGLALGWANAQAAARTLTEQLSESSRQLENLQLELARAALYDALADVARGADHKLRDPLSVILGHAQMLRRDLSDPEAARKLTQIEKAVATISEILGGLREFAQLAPPRPAELDLARLLSELREEWVRRSGLGPEKLQVRVSDADEHGKPLRLLADPQQLRQALEELIANAVEAVRPTGGTITIEARGGVVAPPRTTAAAERPAAAQRWVELAVRDTGIGMGPELVERVFEPFFPLKPAGGGLGIGLARARRIVEAHGGRVWCDSRPGAGSTFFMLLPQAPGSA